MNLGRLNVTKRNWSFFLFVNFFSVHSDLHQVTAFSCGFVHCSVFDRCSECCLLHFEKNACFVLCYPQMNLTENKQLLGSTMTPSLLHWEQELFPWELFHASPYTVRYLQWVPCAPLPCSFLPPRVWEASATGLLSTAGQGIFHLCQGRGSS